MLHDALDNIYLKLKVDAQSILLPLKHVQIILRLPALHEVPSDAKGFEGILNYHGVSVPVYNLGAHVGAAQVVPDIDTPLVLCQFKAGLLGILVSDVEEVVAVKAEDVQKPELSQLPAFVTGAYESEVESMWVIQLDALLDPKAYLVRVADE